MAEEEVGIAEVKARLSEILRRVADGSPVTITDRGHPIARLIPIDDQQANRQRLIEAGVITPARRPREPLPPLIDIGSHEDLFDRNAV
jgi:prevent-host-death family protein